eukprot:359170-Chlamydomonas_euryale.AAC.9
MGTKRMCGELGSTQGFERYAHRDAVNAVQSVCCMCVGRNPHCGAGACCPPKLNPPPPALPPKLNVCAPAGGAPNW